MGSLIFSKHLIIITMSTHLSCIFQRANSFTNSSHLVISVYGIGMCREDTVMGVQRQEEESGGSNQPIRILGDASCKRAMGEQKEIVRNPSGDSTFTRTDPLIYPFIYWQVNIASLKSFPLTEIQIIFIKTLFHNLYFPM